MRLLRRVQRRGDTVPEAADADAFVRAGPLLRSWGVEQDAADVPVLVVPFPIAYLVTVRAWTHLMVLTRWHKAAFGHDIRWKGQDPSAGRVVPSWPPDDAACWAQSGMRQNDDDRNNDLTPEFLEAALKVNSSACIHVYSTCDSTMILIIEDGLCFKLCYCIALEAAIFQLREWSRTILEHSANPAEDKDLLDQYVSTFQSWYADLLSSHGVAPGLSFHRKFVHSSKVLVKCVRMASFLKSGPSALVDVLEQGLSLVAPRFISNGLLEALHKKPSKPPSPSLLRRYELALDIALILAVRARQGRGHGDSFKFGHADSSPMAGFDWLWTQTTELSMQNSVRALKAVHTLAASAGEVRRCIDAGRLELEPAIDQMLPRWKPWLAIINESFVEVINPPAALGSGHRGLANKASHLMFAEALHLPANKRLSEATEAFRCMTTDMGVEMSMADMYCSAPEELLPEWVVHAQIVPDGDRCSDTIDEGVGPPLSGDDVADVHLDQDLDDSAMSVSMTPVQPSESEHSESSALLCSDGDDGPAPLADMPSPAAAAASPDAVAAPVADMPPPPPDAVAAPAADMPPPDAVAALVSDMLPPDAGAAPCGAAEERMLLQNSFTIPGLQHIVNNLLSDVHTCLTHWPTFWKQCKSIEALLSVQERRLRFVQRCMGYFFCKHVGLKYLLYINILVLFRACMRRCLQGTPLECKDGLFKSVRRSFTNLDGGQCWSSCERSSRWFRSLRQHGTSRSTCPMLMTQGLLAERKRACSRSRMAVPALQVLTRMNWRGFCDQGCSSLICLCASCWKRSRRR